MIVGAAGSCVTFGKEGLVGFASVKQGALLPCGDDHTFPSHTFRLRYGIRPSRCCSLL
jgi:hypothetical protein